MMDNISIVVDSEVLSKWKYDFIYRLSKSSEINEIIVWKKTSRASYKNFIYKFFTYNLSNLSLVGKFSSIPRNYTSNFFGINGNLLWLSELSLPKDYQDTIYFVGNCEGKNYSLNSYLSKNNKRNYGNFSMLIKKQRNILQILSYSYTELIGYNPIKTINQHLGSLQYLTNGLAFPGKYKDVQTILKQNTEIKTNEFENGIVHKFIAKVFNWLLYFTSWSLYEYPNIVSTVSRNTLEANKLNKLFEDPPWRFKADPFFNQKSGEMLVEDFNYFTGRGHLCTFPYLRPEDITEVITPSKIHYSYPQIISNKEDIYLIPESAQNNRIDLYKLEDGKASFVKTLVDSFAGIDPTVVYSQNKYWLFATDGNGGSYWKLHIWYSDDLLGEWIPHILNPVKSDVRSSRGAGAIYKDGSRLIRPTQNCFPNYGSSISLNEINKLTPNEFEETVVGEILPPEDGEFTGIHTIANVENKTVVDLKTQPFLPGARILPLLRSRGKVNSSYSDVDNSLLKRWGLLIIMGASLILFYLFGWQTLSFFG